MNFYKHHIGDYDADTAHLSMLEDAAYSRLMRAYYRMEQPIPADLKAACRLVRAISKAEREAVATVLKEFFDLQENGWCNKRCNEEITAYQAQATTNRRIAVAREAARNNNESLYESSAKREPNHKPLTNNQEPLTTNQEPELQTHKSKVKNNGADAPDWMPSVWADFEKHRAEKRQTLTPTARALMISKLDRWRNEGKDITAIIRNSLENGYTGLFEINQKNQSNQDAGDEAKRLIFGGERDISDGSERV